MAEAPEPHEQVDRPVSAPPSDPNPLTAASQRPAAPLTEASPRDPRAALLATHLAVGRRMVQAQEKVLVAFLSGGAVQPAKPTARLLSGASVHRDRGSLTAILRLSLDRYPFLAHHTLGGPVSRVDPTLTGLPVMPLTMTLELAAEAALDVSPGLVCVGFENVVARRWVALDTGDHAELEITAARRDPVLGGVTTIAVEIATAGTRGRGEAHFSADVRLAPSYPSAPLTRPVQHGAGSRWDRERVYRKAMFHGPMFQGIEQVMRLDDGGADAVIQVLERKGLLADGEPAFAVDPVLLDQPGQVVGVWTAERLASGFVIFPTRLARLDLFSSPPAVGSRLACHADIRLVGEAGVVSDLDVDDGAGRVHARFVAWEDKRFDVPASFLAFMLDPAGSSLCRPWIPGEPTRSDARFSGGVHIARPDLPSGFAARGGIWQQVLAGLILSRRERETWHGFAGSSADGGQWLLSRLAAKDATKLWLAGRGLAIPPADIAITGGASGELRATGEWSSAAGGPLDVVVEFVKEDAVAAVRPRPGQAAPAWSGHTAVPSAAR